MTPLPGDEDQGLRVFKASGRSMEPLIRQGAEVGVLSEAADRLAVGSVVAFRMGGTTFAHRLIAKRHEAGRLQLREKGDARAAATWIEADQVIGRAIWVAHGGRVRSLGAPSASGRIALLAAASRLEADLAQLLGGLLPGRTPGLLETALRPLKAAALPTLASVYPEVHLDDGPELAFLLSSLRADCGVPEAARPAPDHLDDLRLLQAATWHGMVPALLRTAGGDLPTGIRQALERCRLRDALVRLQASATLREAGAALEGAGVTCLVLKGAAIAPLYPASERVSADLDLLVAEADVGRARDALAAAGYGPRPSRGRRRFHFHQVLAPSRPGRVPIELHWAIADGANLHRVDLAAMIARRCRTEADGCAFDVPAPEDQLLYLALHAARHGIFNRRGLRQGQPASWFCRPLLGNRLLWFSDLHRFLSSRAATLDWHAARERARDWNIGEDLETVLGVMEVLLPGGAAEPARERLGLGPAPGRGREGGRTRRSSPSESTILRAVMRSGGRFHFRPARVSDLMRLLAPSGARMRSYWRPASRAPLPLLYLRHPFHILRKALRI